MPPGSCYASAASWPTHLPDPTVSELPTVSSLLTPLINFIALILNPFGAELPHYGFGDVLTNFTGHRIFGGSCRYAERMG